MRPINQPLVHSADLVASSPLSNDTQACGAQSPCGHDHHVRQAVFDDEEPGERRPDAMYAQNGDAAADGGHALARPPLLTSPPVKRRRSEDGERTKRAARGDVQRGCESDSGLPNQALASHHHHHHHHHKKTAGSDNADQAKGDLHGVCTLEEGSLKLKISLHRPHAVTPDGLSTAKPPGDKATASRPPSPPSLDKSEADEHSLCGLLAARHSPAPPASLAASDGGVRKVEPVSQNVCCDSNKTLGAVSSESFFVPFAVRKVELPKVPTSDGVASQLSTKDSLLTPVPDTSDHFPNSAVKTNTPAVGCLPPRHSAINTASSTLSKILTERNTDFSQQSSKLSGTHTIPKELMHRTDTRATVHSAAGGRSLPRKSTTPGHYVPYQPPQNRRRLIQDTSKLKCKMRGHTDLPVLQPLESRKSPQTFHHVHVSVGQNGGRGFVNHNSILDHPSVHARMFPSGSPPPPTRLAALLNSGKSQGSSASRQPVVQSKAGTSLEHQPLDLSRTVTKAMVPRVSCLGQVRPNYVPPIGLFYMRSDSRYRLDSIIKKLWAKHNSATMRGRPRP